MSALQAQFISEARDLIQASGAALLETEREPSDPEPINELFRAMHTLKGSSGLLDIAPLTHLVHAGEDLLVQVKESKQPLSGADLDLLFDCFDVLSAWIDALEDDDALPADAGSVAQAKASALRGRLRSAKQPAAEESAPAGAPPAPGAEFAVVARDIPEHAIEAARAAAGGRPLVALRYEADEQCCFRGEDPLGLWRQTPELLFTHVTDLAPSPAAEEFDPHLSRIAISGLAAAPIERLTEHFAYVLDEAAFAAAPGAAGEAEADAGAQAAAKSLGPTANLGPNAAPARGQLMRDLLVGQQAVLAACDGDATLSQGRAESVERLLLNLCVDEPLAGRGEEVRQAFARWRDAFDLEPAKALLENLAQSVPASGDGSDAPVASESAAAAGGGARKSGKGGSKSRVLKVDEAKIDILVNLIAEYSVAKNALPFLAAEAEQSGGGRELARALKDQSTIFDRLAQEMQNAIMQVRLLPVSVIFDRFPRLVRDVSRKLEKKIELQLLREDTEADKSIIEALGDPMIHLVRNSLDHGIETPEERVEAGKRETATLSIEAEHESDQLIITVRDDGRGIHPEKVKAKAVERGVLTPEEAAEMSDEEAVNLVFRPGFSTKEAVSDLSGRGVGMDAVRTQIQEAGGRVSLTSEVDKGTVVRLCLPLSMAVTRVMTLKVGDEKFGVPMDQVLETVRVKAEDVVAIEGSEAFLLRDKLVPLRRLARLLDLDEDAAEPPDSYPILVARTESGPVGFIVDSFAERMDAILKPLGGVLSGAGCYAGAALMGDGGVLLVLNPRSLI